MRSIAQLKEKKECQENAPSSAEREQDLRCDQHGDDVDSGDGSGNVVDLCASGHESTKDKQSAQVLLNEEASKTHEQSSSERGYRP